MKRIVTILLIICLLCCPLPISAAAENTATIKRSGVKLCSSECYTNSSVICELYQGTIINIIEKNDYYTKVVVIDSMSDKFLLKGYLLNEDISYEKTTQIKHTITITANKTFLYSSADDYSETTAILNKGEIYSCYGEKTADEAYFYVRCGNLFGYIKKTKATIETAPVIIETEGDAVIYFPPIENKNPYLPLIAILSIAILIMAVSLILWLQNSRSRRK